MDHKAFIATLPPDMLARLSRREDAAGLWHLAGHFALIGGLGIWIGLGWPLWWAVLIPQGIAICFLFTLEHEATHKTPFRSAWLNEWVGRVCGLLIVQPFEWFRYFHRAITDTPTFPARTPSFWPGRSQKAGAPICGM